MTASKTRIRLTWGGVFLLAGLSVLAIMKGMSGVATTSVAGILTIIGGYQASRGWTKTTAMKSDSTTTPIE